MLPLGAGGLGQGLKPISSTQQRWRGLVVFFSVVSLRLNISGFLFLHDVWVNHCILVTSRDDKA